MQKRKFHYKNYFKNREEKKYGLSKVYRKIYVGDLFRGTVGEEYGNPEIKQAHLLYALLTQENGLIPEVLKGVEIDVERMTSDVLALLEKLPKVRGQSNAYVNVGLSSALDEAEKQAELMKDDFVSVEHLTLGIVIKADEEIKVVLKRYGVNKDVFKSAVKRQRKSTGYKPKPRRDVQRFEKIRK